MQARRVYKRPKKTAVSLTSLLDLLFVMIFVSLLQQQKVKTPPVKETKKGKLTQVKIPVKEKVKTPVVAVPKTYSLNATFNFYPTASNPNIATGTYQMQGSFDEKTRSLRLGGVSWIKRPKDYDMVPLSGTINRANALFTGRIEFIGCKEFSLRKTKAITGNPISGVWEGEYDCSQGATGLTLTID